MPRHRRPSIRGNWDSVIDIDRPRGKRGRRSRRDGQSPPPHDGLMDSVDLPHLAYLEAPETYSSWEDDWSTDPEASWSDANDREEASFDDEDSYD